MIHIVVQHLLSSVDQELHMEVLALALGLGVPATHLHAYAFEHAILFLVCTATGMHCLTMPTVAVALLASLTCWTQP